MDNSITEKNGLDPKEEFYKQKSWERATILWVHNSCQRCDFHVLSLVFLFIWRN